MSLQRHRLDQHQRPHKARSLKHRPDGTIRVVPIPPVLVRILRRHLRDHGITPDGRLFRGTRGGMLSESVYGRTRDAARRAALGPELAATALARRPYDLRHAALSWWLNATGAPAEVAARAGNSARVLHDVYLRCIDSQQAHISQQIEDALDADASNRPSSQCVKASGYTAVGSAPDPVRLSVDRSLVPRIAHARQNQRTRATSYRYQHSLEFPQLKQHLNRSHPISSGGSIRPAHGPRGIADGLGNRSLPGEKPVTQSSVTGSDLRECVAGVGFEPT